MIGDQDALGHRLESEALETVCRAVGSPLAIYPTQGGVHLLYPVPEQHGSRDWKWSLRLANGSDVSGELRYRCQVIAHSEPEAQSLAAVHEPAEPPNLDALKRVAASRHQAEVTRTTEGEYYRNLGGDHPSPHVTAARRLLASDSFRLRAECSLAECTTYRHREVFAVTLRYLCRPGHWNKGEDFAVAVAVGCSNRLPDPLCPAEAEAVGLDALATRNRILPDLKAGFSKVQAGRGRRSGKARAARAESLQSWHRRRRERYLQTCSLIQDGYSMRQVARRLGWRGVKTSRSTVSRDCQLADRLEARRLAGDLTEALVRGVPSNQYSSPSPCSSSGSTSPCSSSEGISGGVTHTLEKLTPDPASVSLRVFLKKLTHEFRSLTGKSRWRRIKYKRDMGLLEELDKFIEPRWCPINLGRRFTRTQNQKGGHPAGQGTRQAEVLALETP